MKMVDEKVNSERKDEEKGHSKNLKEKECLGKNIDITVMNINLGP